MAATPHILVVEDEPLVAEVLVEVLRASDFTVTWLAAGTPAVEVARKLACDLVLLDVQLPDASGFDICRAVRADAALHALPIVMLTGRGRETDRIVGLEVGADDYITKPFSAREVVLRLRAVLRRTRAAAPAPAGGDRPLQAGRVRLDPGTRQVHVGGARVRMTAKEFDLLRALLAGDGRALSRGDLLRDVWGYAGDDLQTRTIDAHIMQLRRKLGAEAWRIETIERFGYRLDGAPDESFTPS
ncbi:MAG: response regulator transcription factor [Vicinamibacterales bacterium]